MTRWLTRRRFVTDLGRTALGVVFVGGALAACGGDDADDPVGDGTRGPTDGEPTATAPSTEAPNGVTWERIVLGPVSAFVVARGGEAVLVDTGVPGSEGAIEATLIEMGFGWDAVGHVVLTHRHGDHVGSVPAVLTAAPQATGYAGAGDIDAITSPRPITAVGDGDQVFGLDIIETPGHTPGHISVVEPTLRLLIAGDALNGPGSGLDGPRGIAGPNPQYTSDLDQGHDSVRKLAELDLDAVAFGHGDPVTADAAAAIRALAETV